MIEECGRGVRADSGRDRLVRTADVVETDSGRSGRTDSGRDGQGDEGAGERERGYISGRETGSFVRGKRELQRECTTK